MGDKIKVYSKDDIWEKERKNSQWPSKETRSLQTTFKFEIKRSTISSGWAE